jgi:hypothetical protein
MDNRITEVFEIHSGKKYVIIDRFKFNEFRVNKYIITCTSRKCNITVKVPQNLKFVISINADSHINHEAYINNVSIKKEGNYRFNCKTK